MNYKTIKDEALADPTGVAAVSDENERKTETDTFPEYEYADEQPLQGITLPRQPAELLER